MVNFSLGNPDAAEDMDEGMGCPGGPCSTKLMIYKSLPRVWTGRRTNGCSSVRPEERRRFSCWPTPPRARLTVTDGSGFELMARVR